MRVFIAAFLMLFLMNSLAAEKNFISGYIITEMDETIFVDLYIPQTGRLQTKKDGGKTVKYKRKSLKDYGYLENGEKKSRFAATAFSVPTYEGYYVTSRTGDTTEGYFTRWTEDFIVLFEKPNNIRAKLSPTWIEGFAIKKGKIYEWYDKIDFTVEVGLFDAEISDEKFCEPIIEGKIKLYKTIVTISHPGHMGANGMMTGGGQQAFPVYVFVIDDKIYALEYRLVRSNTKILRELKKVFADYSELFDSINKTAFEKSDIPNLVRKYNEHFAK